MLHVMIQNFGQDSMVLWASFAPVTDINYYYLFFISILSLFMEDPFKK